MEENAEAWELWQAVQTQWRASGFGLIGLDYVAVNQEAIRLQIDLSNCLMQKIRALEHHTLKEQAKADDTSNGQKYIPNQKVHRQRKAR